MFLGLSDWDFCCLRGEAICTQVPEVLARQFFLATHVHWQLPLDQTMRGWILFSCLGRRMFLRGQMQVSTHRSWRLMSGNHSLMQVLLPTLFMFFSKLLLLNSRCGTGWISWFHAYGMHNMQKKQQRCSVLRALLFLTQTAAKSVSQRQLFRFYYNIHFKKQCFSM